MNRSAWHLRANALVLGWLLAAGALVLVHRFVPDAPWLMVHLLLLGAVSTAILVWSQHFADTLLRNAPPGGRRLQVAKLAGHTAAALAVVAGMLADVWQVVLLGACLVAGVAITHVVTLVRQSRRALPSRFGHLARFYTVASAMLPVGAGLGVLMARGTLSDEVTSRIYVAHLAVNLLGWVGLTVVGTLLLLWPTALRTRMGAAGETAGRRALPLAASGIVVVVLGCVVGVRSVVGLGVAALLAGLALVWRAGWEPARTAPPRGYATWSLLLSFAWFTACCAAFGVEVLTAGSWGTARAGVGGLVLPFAVGFAAQVLLGALTYLLPVVLGSGPASAKAMIHELDRGAPARLVTVNAGLVLFLLPLPSMVSVTVSLVVFAALVSFVPLLVRAFVAGRKAPSGLPARAAAAGTDDGARGRQDAGDGPVADPTGRAAEAVRGAARRAPASSVAQAVAALVLAVVAGVAADPAAAGLGSVRPADSVAVATGRTTTVRVEAADMRFSPAVVEVPAGDRLVIELVNVDKDVHDLVLEDGSTSGRVSPGESATVDVGVVGADLDGWCSLAGHRLMGMTLAVVAVGGGTGSAVADGTEADGSPSPQVSDLDGIAGHLDHGSADAPSAALDLDLMGVPGPGVPAFPAALPPAGEETVHRATFAVQEVVTEVAPGVRQTLWTFGGRSPGPVLRGKVGDRFEITLVNDGSIGHSIDFHAGALAPDEPMRTLAPGESLTYTFTATRSGIWMYHCSTMPMSLHIANGMFGAVVIDPPGLPEVDREYLLVQSEMYLGPQEGVADASKIAAEEPDLVVFNGYANQYRTSPLTAGVGERVRFWVLDVGPSRSSAFHVVGGQFDTVFLEGEYTLRDGGSTGSGGSQVLGLFAAQGGFVELTFPEAGHYTFVSHAMVDAERGAIGTVEVS